MTPGKRYLGGVIGNEELRDEWIEEKTSFWTSAIRDLAATAKLYPQSAYTAIQCSLQQEWQYVQCLVGDISDGFADVEKAIRTKFFPGLFDNDVGEADNFCTLLSLPVKQAGLAIPDPTISGPTSYDASILVCSHLLAAFRGTTTFSTTDHLSVRKEVFAELLKQKETVYSTTLDSSLLPMSGNTRRTIR